MPQIHDKCFKLNFLPFIYPDSDGAVHRALVPSNENQTVFLFGGAVTFLLEHVAFCSHSITFPDKFPLKCVEIKLQAFTSTDHHYIIRGKLNQ